MDLTSYYRSPEWQAKRDRRLEADEHECRLCGTTDALEVHHKPKCYSQIPGERIEDLTTVCHECHQEIITNLIRRRRYESQIVEAMDVERITPGVKDICMGEGKEAVNDSLDVARVTPPMKPITPRRHEHEEIAGTDYGRVTPPLSQREAG